MKKENLRQIFSTENRAIKHASMLLLTGLAFWGIVLLSGGPNIFIPQNPR